jgi:hypothetical protein
VNQNDFVGYERERNDLVTTGIAGKPTIVLGFTINSL